MFKLPVRVKSRLISFLDFVWPKDKTLVLFGQKRGGYSDNSRALFEYMQKHSDLKVVWLTTNSRLIDNVHFFHPESWQGLKLALRAKTFVVSHGAGDISYSGAFSARKLFVVVWHGIPLKRIALLDANLKDPLRVRQITKEIAKYNLYIAASEAEAKTLMACRKLASTDPIKITGLPRNDALFSVTDPLETRIAPALAVKLEQKVVLYAPTFRDNRETKFLPFDDVNLGELYAQLVADDAYLLFRPHPNDTANIERLKSICNSHGEHFVLADNRQVPDVAELLPFVDTIITDYSSIYIDLLLRDCTCIFIPYDLAEYERERGFLYEYGEVTPGPKVDSFIEFLNALHSCLTDSNYFRTERQQAKALFHHHQDANAAQRVTALIEQNLERR